MIPRRRFLSQGLWASVGLAALGLPGRAAAKKKKRSRGRHPMKGKASELPKVTGVDADSISVGGKYYVVRDDASITVNGEEATLRQIKVGMQVMVTGKVLTYGSTREDTIYQATRIVARTDNQLAKKAAAHNKKARAQNSRNNRRRRR